MPNNDSTMAGISGLFTSSYALGTAIGPLVGGQLITRYGYRVATVPMLFCMLILTAVVIIYIVKIKKEVSTVHLNGISTVANAVK